MTTELDRLHAQLLPDLERIEAGRRAMLGVFAFCGLLAVGTMAAWGWSMVAYPLPPKDELQLFLRIFWPVPPILLVGWAAVLSFNRFVRATNDLTLPGLLRILAPGLRHEAGASLSRDDFEASLFQPNFVLKARLKGGDLLAGTVGDRPFRASRVNVSIGNEAVLAGVLAQIKLERPVAGHVVLAPFRGLESFGKLGKAAMVLEGDKSRGVPVAIEEAGLDKHFAVYASDPKLAETILTPDRCRRLVALAERTPGWGLRVSFVGDHAYVGLPGERWLQPSPFRDARGRVGFDADVAELKLLLDLPALVG